MKKFSLLLGATLLKNFRIRMQAPWSFALQIFSATAMLLVFYIVDHFQNELVGDVLKKSLTGLNTSYFGYVALGLAMAELSNSSLGGILGQYQMDKRHQLMEHYLFSGVGIRRWAMVSGIANIFHAIFQFTVIFFVAVVFLGLEVGPFRFDLALLVFLMAMLPMWCLSLVSLSGVLLFRRGNILGFLLGLSFELLGGVYAPNTIFPSYLKSFSEILPITPALRSLQQIIYAQGTWDSISGDMLQLLVQTILILPVSLFLLSVADKKARKKGHYILD